jgi:hypothetical protein
MIFTLGVQGISYASPILLLMNRPRLEQAMSSNVRFATQPLADRGKVCQERFGESNRPTGTRARGLGPGSNSARLCWPLIDKVMQYELRSWTARRGS